MGLRQLGLLLCLYAALALEPPASSCVSSTSRNAPALRRKRELWTSLIAQIQTSSNGAKTRRARRGATAPLLRPRPSFCVKSLDQRLGGLVVAAGHNVEAPIKR